jgi:hypothetical protein
MELLFVQRSQSTLVLTTGCLKDIPVRLESLLTMRLITVDEQTKKSIVDIQIQNLVQCLGGTVTRQILLDSKGKTCKRIIITYEESA